MQENDIDKKKRQEKADEALSFFAEDLAKRHTLDPQRVRDIFNKLIDAEWFSPNFPNETALDVAISFVGPEKALEIFETNPLEELRLKVNTTELVFKSDLYLPFYTLKELALVGSKYIDFQKRERSSIIETGFPQHTFNRSGWFDWHLGRLYYVKIPIDLALHQGRTGLFPFVNTLQPENDEDIPKYNSIWIRENTEIATRSVGLVQDEDWAYETPMVYRSEYRVSEGKYFSKNDTEVTRCEYAKAPFMDFIPRDMALRLESYRERLIDLRIAIVEKLIRFAQIGDASGLWERCLDILRETVTSDEAEFLLRADRMLTHLMVDISLDHPYRLICYNHYNAGFSDIIYAIGHFEKELTVGSMQRPRNILDQIPRNEVFESYYETLDKPWHSLVDEAIGVFQSLREPDGEFWSAFMARVNEALENEFYAEVVTRQKVKRKFKEKYILTVSSYGNFVAAQLNETGHVPPLTPVPPEDDETTEENIFRWERDFWKLRFKGKDAPPIKDSKGMHHIAYLLSKPGEEIPAFTLNAIYYKAFLSQSDTLSGKMSDERFDEHGIAREDGLSKQEILDNTARANLKKSLDDLNDEREIAEDLGNNAKVTEIEDEIDIILSDVASSTGLGGKDRGMKDDAKSAGKAVAKCIREAIASIMDQHPAMGEHLDSAIDKGILCKYTLKTPTIWAL